uniref:Uncharacterized protein n=1 Tax=Salix viminalis TaxID=40686 RepID=A0A6N2K0H9_SALVM
MKSLEQINRFKTVLISIIMFVYDLIGLVPHGLARVFLRAQHFYSWAARQVETKLRKEDEQPAGLVARQNNNEKRSGIGDEKEELNGAVLTLLRGPLNSSKATFPIVVSKIHDSSSLLEQKKMVFDEFW